MPVFALRRRLLFTLVRKVLKMVPAEGHRA